MLTIDHFWVSDPFLSFWSNPLFSLGLFIATTFTLGLIYVLQSNLTVIHRLRQSMHALWNQNSKNLELWKLTIPELRVLALTKRHVGSGNKIDRSVKFANKLIMSCHRNAIFCYSILFSQKFCSCFILWTFTWFDQYRYCYSIVGFHVT